MKLTEPQREVLACLGDPSVVTMSAYAMGCSLATPWAMQKHRLVDPLGGSGSMAFPRNMQWRITEAGRALLSQEMDNG